MLLLFTLTLCRHGSLQLLVAAVCCSWTMGNAGSTSLWPTATSRSSHWLGTANHGHWELQAAVLADGQCKQTVSWPASTLPRWAVSCPPQLYTVWLGPTLTNSGKFRFKAFIQILAPLFQSSPLTVYTHANFRPVVTRLDGEDLQFSEFAFYVLCGIFGAKALSTSLQTFCLLRIVSSYFFATTALRRGILKQWDRTLG
uniref:Uncharacterized protein n=1 Tax=Chelydra serpentina TaxID=8475 RepID=A0A8C3RRD4_CHESE